MVETDCRPTRVARQSGECADDELHLAPSEIEHWVKSSIGTACLTAAVRKGRQTETIRAIGLLRQSPRDHESPNSS
jgi:hypothetical protein